MKEPRITLYDESALNLVAFYQRVVDCSRLLKNMSPAARKIADNVINIVRGKDLHYPRYRAHALTLYRSSHRDPKEFQALVDRYYPQYWDYMRRMQKDRKKSRR